jgi:hypothetical protein
VLLLLQQRSVCCRCCSKGVCVAAVAAKECVLPLLQQRSVCCRCCSKGVCVAAVVVKECVLPLLQQRSVCCRYCGKGVCVATIAAKEQSELCSKRNCVSAIPTVLTSEELSDRVSLQLAIMVKYVENVNAQWNRIH